MKLNKYFSYLLNALFLLLVVAISFAIATIALTKKINEFQTRFNQGAQGVVNKQVVTMLNLSSGIVSQVYVQTGQPVKKGDLLVSIKNPLLTDTLRAYEAFQDNASAQTEAAITRSQLNSLNIYSPTDGLVGDIYVAEGSSVVQFSKVMDVYSSQNVRLLAYLTIDQYQAMQRLQQGYAYSKRLNQTFTVKPDVLKPDERVSSNYNASKIGLYFTFNNATDAASLLQKEDMDLYLDTNTQKVTKPIDIFVNFWNGLISKPTNEH